jgi:hypothetical protein
MLFGNKSAYVEFHMQYKFRKMQNKFWMNIPAQKGGTPQRKM